MFCIDEIMIHQDLTAIIQEGKKSDPSIQMVLSLFPRNYATFEVITLIRIFYFLCFNIICAISLTYVQDESRMRVEYGERMRENQVKMTEVATSLMGAYSK